LFTFFFIKDLLLLKLKMKLRRLCRCIMIMSSMVPDWGLWILLVVMLELVSG